MPITFRYKKINRPAPLEPIHAPAIPITLIGRKEKLDVIALVDSGADVSAISKDLADILGVDLAGKQEEVVGIGGKVPSVRTRIDASIRNAHERYTFTLNVMVVLDEKIEFGILLGRRDFFENFDVTFRENEEKIILKKVPPRHDAVMRI
ncbi:retroviral-like aspartic protease [Candidatus Micrarchaeota archaeon]|nr:retroviral-like aspartic protease [Candidatus Micrarchaeota archaeon]